jgi:hypothetical protein
MGFCVAVGAGALVLVGAGVTVAGFGVAVGGGEPVFVGAVVGVGPVMPAGVGVAVACTEVFAVAVGV